MSTLEKFGILVILILVVIIGVVAVWGVRPDEANPFEKAGDGTAAVPEDPAAQPGNWPADGGGTALAGDPAAGPVAPPAIGSGVTPPTVGAPPVATAPTGGSTYRVKSGDTLEKIAKETLGDGTRWPEIVKANPGLNPKRLKITQELKIPGGSGGTSVAIAPATTTTPPAPVRGFAETPNPSDGPSDGAMSTAPATREVEVRSGDTLYGIAQRELGNSNLYYKIQQANPGLDPKRLKPGMKIKLPL